MLTKKSASETNELENQDMKNIKAASPSQKPAQPSLFPQDPAMRQYQKSKESDSPAAAQIASPAAQIETLPVKKQTTALMATQSAATASKPIKTRVIVKFDVGFGNHLTIRGKGANLCWEKGIILHNIQADEWLWETDIPFTKCEFKVLINDESYESGENHSIKCGASFQYTPFF